MLHSTNVQVKYIRERGKAELQTRVSAAISHRDRVLVAHPHRALAASHFYRIDWVGVQKLVLRD